MIPKFPLAESIYLPDTSKLLRDLVMGDGIPRALTIAGSDSGGGAGIQADLKTFAALGVHGMSALTTITAQNTLDIIAVYDIPTEIIKAQIKAVVEDIGVDAVKTGMLHTTDIVNAVTEELKGSQLPIVVDPVMVAKGGVRLITPEAEIALIERILPLATVLTPNATEAEALSGIEIESLEKGKAAAAKISELGPKTVVIKGGHIPSKKTVTDILYMDGEFELFSGEKIETKTSHGTGCTFASAIAAELAKGETIKNAVRVSKEFVAKALRYGLNLGKGYGPVNPTAWLYNEAEKYKTWENVVEAVRLLESKQRIIHLVPEVQINLVMATPHATTVSDVVGVPGRIVRLRDHVKASSCPEFGVSRHVASMVLTAMKRDPSVRAGMNIRYSSEIIRVCEELGFRIASYDRRNEPEELKEVEGATIPWGTRAAIESTGVVPDIIYHLGALGKEAMATILATSAVEAVEKAIKIAVAIRNSTLA